MPDKILIDNKMAYWLASLLFTKKKNLLFVL